MGKYVDGNEKINVEDLSEICSGVVVDGKNWQRELMIKLSSDLSLVDIMANAVDYPDALKNDIVLDTEKDKYTISDKVYTQEFLENANDEFFLQDRKDWKQKYYVRDGLDSEDKEHIMMTYTEKLDKYKSIVYEEVRCTFYPTEINGLFAMEKVEKFTENIHNKAIRGILNISDDDYIKICKHDKQRATTVPVCLDGVKIANVLNMDYYDSQFALVHRDGRVLQLDNGNRFGDLTVKEYPCKSNIKVTDLSVLEDKKNKNKNKEM